ncbi:MAG: hypothetical protein KGJ12_00945 [Gammaproteobacteria bacterium]|nr:hypothetical protein [Gammaproteobacteria bacterium]
MRDKLQQLLVRIDAMSLRERGLLLLALLVIVIMLWNKLLLDPLSSQQRQLQSQMHLLRTQIATTEQQAQAIIARNAQDPNRANRERYKRLQSQIADLDQRLQTLTVDLIPPTRMAKVLEQVLNQQAGLKLIRLQSLGAQPLLEPPPATTGKSPGTAATGAVPGVYKHGMIIEFDGDYMDTLKYLRALQALPWRFYWDGLKYQVKKYPRARVTITVHTLSLQEGWIGV